MQSLEQQLDNLRVLERRWTEEPVDKAGCQASQPEQIQSSQPLRLPRLLQSLRLPRLPQLSQLPQSLLDALPTPLRTPAFSPWRSQRRWQWVGLGMGFALSVGITSAVAVAHQRYSDRSLFNIPLQTEAVEGHTWTGEGISFHQLDGDHFDVSFNLSGDQDAQLVLRDIDLTLMIPEVPVTAQGNPDLTRWFLTEREFNRQRVIFEPGSTHIDLPDGLDGYNAEDLSIALTNNCLGAGYWELAVSAPNGEGELEKIYQGYFTFPRGVYAEIVSWLNPSSYWQQARTMEAWPGFDFLSGLPFALSELRTVDAETVVPVTDLKTEEIIAKNEQIKKESLIVYADGTDADDIRTWEDIRQADLRFQSFVTPGIYDESRLWESDFSQLKTVVSAVGRQITSPLADVPFSDEANVEDISVTDSQQQALVEVELDFESEAGELRRLVVSGIDWAQVPQLESVDYSDGVYMPLGFGTPFTQSYGDLQETPPAQSPFFSVFLDADNRVIDYRQDIGVNGLVMHRDVDDPDLLHLYLMSYERITLIGHYVVDLDMYELPQY